MTVADLITQLQELPEDEKRLPVQIAYVGRDHLDDTHWMGEEVTSLVRPSMAGHDRSVWFGKVSLTHI